MHFAMKNGQICFSLRKFLAISSAIRKITSDCGCDAVVHLAFERRKGGVRMWDPKENGDTDRHRKTDHNSRSALLTLSWKIHGSFAFLAFVGIGRGTVERREGGIRMWDPKENGETD